MKKLSFNKIFSTILRRLNHPMSARLGASVSDLDVDKRLSVEILKIERLRLSILIGLGIIATAQAFITEFFLPESSRPLRGVFSNFSLVNWGLFMLAATLYESIALLLTHKAILIQHSPPLWVPYLSVMVELGFPSVVIYLQGPNIHPMYAAHTPFIGLKR